MEPRNPAKRIPKSLGTDTKLFGNYSLSDVAVGLLPSVAVVLLLQILVPSSTIAGYSLQSFTLPLAVLTIGLGALFVYLTPAYADSIQWLASFLSFQASGSQHDHETASEHTRIERVHADHDMLERTDGAFVGMVQVDPPSMALATDDEWRQKAEQFQDFCNAAVEFPIQLYSTTERFPVDEHLAQYEARLDDPDVRDNPRLESLIESYVDWYGDELAERRMTIRDHYVIVPVRPREVQFERESLAQQLTALPIVGVFVRAIYAPRRAIERDAMREALGDRLDRVEAGLRDIDGCATQRVDATEAAELVAEFWGENPKAYGDIDHALRTRPLVGGSR